MATGLEADLIGALRDESSQQEVAIERRADSLVLTFPEPIVFDPGQAQLKPFAQPILEKVASVILDRPNLTIEVQGHTDNRPINTKRYPSNWELSVDRATQVARALIRLGVDPNQLSVKGFGEYRALYPNDTEMNQLKNRRVEIQFSLAPKS
jgi:chemotaxis protein MotB